ncbi:hypothetical protein AYO20_11782 [Fonsecaea nubica]|uniref:Uncharacterized protein n=1 Tax=Fonsecaea nubica TaxID=856822 RepID=A0A178BMD0_9EURO|nr:hypothetical protein AYO20_11782 [Fonsecaea nubica]OAL18015.1 hypothetical protein AYO20_11782 [Fonsecaea nubica]
MSHPRDRQTRSVTPPPRHREPSPNTDESPSTLDHPNHSPSQGLEGGDQARRHHTVMQTAIHHPQPALYSHQPWGPPPAYPPGHPSANNGPLGYYPSSHNAYQPPTYNAQQPWSTAPAYPPGYEPWANNANHAPAPRDPSPPPAHLPRQPGHSPPATPPSPPLRLRPVDRHRPDNPDTHWRGHWARRARRMGSDRRTWTREEEQQDTQAQQEPRRHQGRSRGQGRSRDRNRGRGRGRGRGRAGRNMHNEAWQGQGPQPPPLADIFGENSMTDADFSQPTLGPRGQHEDVEEVFRFGMFGQRDSFTGDRTTNGDRRRDPATTPSADGTAHSAPQTNSPPGSPTQNGESSASPSSATPSPAEPNSPGAHVNGIESAHTRSAFSPVRQTIPDPDSVVVEIPRTRSAFSPTRPTPPDPDSVVVEIPRTRSTWSPTRPTPADPDSVIIIPHNPDRPRRGAGVRRNPASSWAREHPHLTLWEMLAYHNARAWLANAAAYRAAVEQGTRAEPWLDAELNPARRDRSALYRNFLDPSQDQTTIQDRIDEYTDVLRTLSPARHNVYWDTTSGRCFRRLPLAVTNPRNCWLTRYFNNEGVTLNCPCQNEEGPDNQSDCPYKNAENLDNDGNCPCVAMLHTNHVHPSDSDPQLTLPTESTDREELNHRRRTAWKKVEGVIPPPASAGESAIRTLIDHMKMSASIPDDALDALKAGITSQEAEELDHWNLGLDPKSEKTWLMTHYPSCPGVPFGGAPMCVESLHAKSEDDETQTILRFKSGFTCHRHRDPDIPEPKPEDKDMWGALVWPMCPGEPDGGICIKLIPCTKRDKAPMGTRLFGMPGPCDKHALEEWGLPIANRRRRR